MPAVRRVKLAAEHLLVLEDWPDPPHLYTENICEMERQESQPPVAPS